MQRPADPRRKTGAMPCPQYSRTTESALGLDVEHWIVCRGRAKARHWPDVRMHRATWPRNRPAEPPRLDRRLADQEHPAGVAVEAISLVTVIIHVEDIAAFQDRCRPGCRGEPMVDRECRMDFGSRLVIQGCRDRVLGIHDEVVADPDRASTVVMPAAIRGPIMSRTSAARRRQSASRPVRPAI